MEEAGFEDVGIRTIHGAWTAPSVAWVSERAERLCRYSPPYAMLKDADQRRVREALLHRLPVMPGGEIRIPAAAHVALGRRAAR
ncbi:hypothetical protein J4558_26575 [Leptolyngbya sp. 15MV]|nr:hypothetical protein J4558_26575 [Leptolyngbya sp. 15MV]